MSRIKCWLDMHDRLPELSDFVHDDPRETEEEGNQADQALIHESPVWMNSVSSTSASEQEPF